MYRLNHVVTFIMTLIKVIKINQQLLKNKVTFPKGQSIALRKALSPLWLHLHARPYQLLVYLVLVTPGLLVLKVMGKRRSARCTQMRVYKTV